MEVIFNLELNLKKKKGSFKEEGRQLCQFMLRLVYSDYRQSQLIVLNISQNALQNKPYSV